MPCRHGLTAETVIDALEDAEDYAAFEMAVTADYDAQSAVERELVLRLASVLWRLRRASAIEAGLLGSRLANCCSFGHEGRTIVTVKRSLMKWTGTPSLVKAILRIMRHRSGLQACQILFTLQCLDRRKPWERRRLR